MRSIVVRYTLRAPLCHGAFGPSGGNAVVLRREPIVSLPGTPHVPCISGNATRGITRRIVMRELFRRAGLGVGELPGRQWDLLYGALANGGHLTGAEKTPHPDAVRELREALPPLSVYGTALYRYLLPGRVRFGFAWPVCEETVWAGLVGYEEGADSVVLPAGDLVTEVGLVRHVDRDEQDPEATGVTPMPVVVEALATGTVLEQVVYFSSAASDVEIGAVIHGLQQVTGLGGKGGAGLGAVGVEAEGDSTPYTTWIEQTPSEELRARLVDLAERIA